MKDNNINRRKFLKYTGLGSLSALALSACKNISSDTSTTAGKAGSGKMEVRINKSTGDKVSLLGFGCMRFPTIPVDNSEDEIIDQESVNSMFDYAIEHGVNYFDTSPAYCKGKSEETAGIALSRHPRDKYLIATKLSNFAPETWTHEESMKMYNNSFKNLKADYIDYMLLHSVGKPNEELTGMEVFEHRYVNNGMLYFLLEERKRGKIRNLGFSYHGDVKVFDNLLAMPIKWDFVQIQMNYVDWLHAKEVDTDNTNANYLYDQLNKRGIQAIIMEPLLGGRLAELPSHIAEQLKRKRPEDSLASWAFRFAGSFSNVLTVLSGMTYKEHLIDNVNTYSPLIKLSDDEKKLLIDTAGKIVRFPTVPCTGCEYCMPCPYGINIPAIFSHYNKCVNDGNDPDSVRDPNYAKARSAFLIGYDRSVPKLRQASHCIGCRQCESHCPQDIEISNALHKIDKYVEALKQDKL